MSQEQLPAIESIILRDDTSLEDMMDHYAEKRAQITKLPVVESDVLKNPDVSLEEVAQHHADKLAQVIKNLGNDCPVIVIDSIPDMK